MGRARQTRRVRPEESAKTPTHKDPNANWANTNIINYTPSEEWQTRNKQIRNAYKEARANAELKWKTAHENAFSYERMGQLGNCEGAMIEGEVAVVKAQKLAFQLLDMQILRRLEYYAWYNSLKPKKIKEGEESINCEIRESMGRLAMTRAKTLNALDEYIEVILERTKADQEYAFAIEPDIADDDPNYLAWIENLTKPQDDRIPTDEEIETAEKERAKEDAEFKSFIEESGL